jgi:hypothetical protein
MTENLETLSGRLLAEGFDIAAVIPNEDLPKKIYEMIIDYAMDKYTDMRIVPGDVALAGQDWQLETPSHIVYVKDNVDHSTYKPGSCRIIQPTFRSARTGEQNIGLPISRIL